MRQEIDQAINQVFGNAEDKLAKIQNQLKNEQKAKSTPPAPKDTPPKLQITERSKQAMLRMYRDILEERILHQEDRIKHTMKHEIYSLADMQEDNLVKILGERIAIMQDCVQQYDIINEQIKE